MRTGLFVHALFLAGLNLGLLGANCEGSGLTEDCTPGELGCACVGGDDVCPEGVRMCCPDPLLVCEAGTCQPFEGGGQTGTQSGTQSGGSATGDDGGTATTSAPQTNSGTDTGQPQTTGDSGTTGDAGTTSAPGPTGTDTGSAGSAGTSTGSG